MTILVHTAKATRRVFYLWDEEYDQPILGIRGRDIQKMLMITGIAIDGFNCARVQWKTFPNGDPKLPVPIIPTYAARTLFINFIRQYKESR